MHVQNAVFVYTHTHAYIHSVNIFFTQLSVCLSFKEIQEVFINAAEVELLVIEMRDDAFWF